MYVWIRQVANSYSYCAFNYYTSLLAALYHIQYREWDGQTEKKKTRSAPQKTVTHAQETDSWQDNVTLFFMFWVCLSFISKYCLFLNLPFKSTFIPAHPYCSWSLRTSSICVWMCVFVCVCVCVCVCESWNKLWSLFIFLVLPASWSGGVVAQ